MLIEHQLTLGRKAERWHCSGSFEATKAEAIGLCLNGLEDRFGNLLIDQTIKRSSSNSTTAVVRDMLVFNIDAWSTNPQDLVVFGNEQKNVWLTGLNLCWQMLDARLTQFLISGFQ